MIYQKIKKLKCKRCGYVWVSRKEIVRTCARCRSPYFDIPAKTKKIKPSETQ